MKRFRYFRHDEFDSPDKPGSGSLMDDGFLEMPDHARHYAGVPFRISSGGGYRTKEYNTELMKRNSKASPKSSHMKGLAADILTPNSAVRCAVLQGLIRAGFNRIGIANGFIHVDDDSSKPADVVWVY